MADGALDGEGNQMQRRSVQRESAHTHRHKHEDQAAAAQAALTASNNEMLQRLAALHTLRTEQAAAPAPALAAAAAAAVRRARFAYRGELALYRAHHARAANWWLHAACVPVEWLAMLLALSALSALSAVASHLPLPAHWLAQLALAAYVAPLALARVVDLLLAALPSFQGRLVVALVAWTCSWLLQVPVGHWQIERNQPSMATQLTLNSVLLSVSLAWDWCIYI
jgi:uncharacterized membrane protein YGL010W